MSLLSYFKASVQQPPNQFATPNVRPPKGSYVQESGKAGILLTSELEKCTRECRARVDRIARTCRAQNRKFRDTEFDLESDRELCLAGLDGIEYDTNPADVRRVTDIFDEPKFYVDGIGAGDVVQGSLGDCWFLSALAIISTTEGLLERCCVARDEKVGVYGFVFFRDHTWVSVIIDDLLYTKIRKYEDLSYDEQTLYHGSKARYDEQARKGSKTLFFASSGTQGETWVPLIEKAYAKLHGNYGYLNGGEAGEAIEDLTGGVTSFIYTKDILDPDEFWTNELLKATRDRVFGVAFFGTDKQGLIANHAYSILRAVEYHGKRFLVIRNPWGNSEWSGRWSDGAKEWTTAGDPDSKRGWLDALEILKHGFGDDGEFVMEYSDFLQTWEQIDRTIVFDDTWVMSSHWLNVTSRALPSAWSYGDVSFTVTVPESTYAIIALSQIDDRYFRDLTGRSTWYFDFSVFKKGESEALLTSPQSRAFKARSVNVELELEKGEYVVHVRLDREVSGEENWYEEGLKTWDKRKLSRLLTQRAQGLSIVSNLKKENAVHLPVPLSTLAGHDLTKLNNKAAEAASALAQLFKDNSQTTTTTSTTSVTTVSQTVVVTKNAEPEETNEKKEEGSEVKKDSDQEKAANQDSDKEVKTDVPQPPIPVPPPSTPDSFKISDEAVVLGLSVYTNKASPVTINGQLRHELQMDFAGLAIA